jgi:hypothetical protein
MEVVVQVEMEVEVEVPVVEAAAVNIIVNKEVLTVVKVTMVKVTLGRANTSIDN